jgi:hypothetical protein
MEPDADIDMALYWWKLGGTSLPQISPPFLTVPRHLGGARDLPPNSKTNLGLQIFHHSALIISATHPTSLIFI